MDLYRPDGRFFFKDQGQKHLVRLVKSYQDRKIHLSYLGNPHLLNPLDSLRYDTGEPVEDEGVEDWLLGHSQGN